MIKFSTSLGSSVRRILNQNGGPWNFCCGLRYHASWLETWTVLCGTVLGFQNVPHLQKFFYVICFFCSIILPTFISRLPVPYLLSLIHNCVTFTISGSFCKHLQEYAIISVIAVTDLIFVKRTHWESTLGFLEASYCGTFHFCTSHLTIIALSISDRFNSTVTYAFFYIAVSVKMWWNITFSYFPWNPCKYSYVFKQKVFLFIYVCFNF